MPRVLNLADVLQHPDDGLHHGALAQQELVLDFHHPVFHVPFNPGDQPDPFRQKPLGEGLRDGPLVADRPTEKIPGEGLADQRDAAIGVARGEHGLDDLPRCVDGEVQLEPVHPAHGAPTARSQTSHVAVLPLHEAGIG